MAITNQLTTIHSCEQATDAVTGCTLSGADSNFTTDAGEYIEGSAAYSFDLDIETHTCVFTPSASLNLTNQNVWIWMMFFTPSFLGTWSSGAVKCRLSDGTNYSEWYLGGSDNPLMTSSFTRIVFYTGSTPDAVSGTLNLSAVTVITYYFTGVTKSKLAQNVFIDYLQYGAATDGIKVTGGGVGTEEAFADVYGDDLTAAAGILQYRNGVYTINGSITFGDTATNNCYFKDTNQIIVAASFYRSFTTGNRGSAESLVGTSHFTITVQNYASGTCNFDLGESAGGRGTSGCIFKSGGDQPIVFNFNDADIDQLRLYGCVFIDCGTFAFPSAISGSEAYDCTWNGCGEIDVESFKFRYCNFVNATSNALQVDTTSFDVQQCNFINPVYAGMEITDTGTYNFYGMNFVGTTGSGPYDVYNNTGETATVTNDEDSNGLDYTGAYVDFQGSATLSLTVKNEAGGPVTGAYAYIDNDNTAPFIMNTTTDVVTGIATTAWTGGAVPGATWRVRKYGYKPYKAVSDVPASGTKDIPVTLIADPQQV